MVNKNWACFNTYAKSDQHWIDRSLIEYATGKTVVRTITCVIIINRRGCLAIDMAPGSWCSLCYNNIRISVSEGIEIEIIFRLELFLFLMLHHFQCLRFGDPGIRHYLDWVLHLYDLDLRISYSIRFGLYLFGYRPPHWYWWGKISLKTLVLG